MRQLTLAMLLSWATLAQAEPAGLGVHGVAPTGPSCTDLEAAPKLTARNADALRARRIFANVRDKVVATTDHEARLSLTAPGAKGSDGSLLPPWAMICAGTPPASMYVTWPLLERILAEAGNAEALLAFVFAHELAHRLNDFAEKAGRLVLSGDRRRDEVARELLADRRAAFFTAAAGYRTGELVRHGLVDKVLRLEFRQYVSDQALLERREGLKDTLRQFAVFAALHDAGVVSLLEGNRARATRLLDWVDELVEGADDKARLPIPEVRLVRALAWLQREGLTARNLGEKISCKPVLPGRTALSVPVADGGLMGPTAARVRQAQRRVRAASRLLDDAARRGANALAIASAKACALWYLGRDAQAMEALTEAEALAKSPTAGAALAFNRALFKGATAPHPKRPAPPKLKPCPSPSRSPAPFTLPAFRTCPTGWRRYGTAPFAPEPPPFAPEPTPSGATLCLPTYAKDAVSERLLTLVLPPDVGQDAPAIRDVVWTKHLDSANDSALCGCAFDATAFLGANDVGELAFEAYGCGTRTGGMQIVFTDERLRPVRLGMWTRHSVD